MKIAACVILYQPDKSVELNIKSYLYYVEKIYLFDNTETKTQHIQPLLSNQKIIFVYNGANEGIAKRLNQACTLAIKDGFDFLLTMDQDSFFDEASISKYLKCINSFDNKSAVSMFGVNYKKQSADENCTYKKTNFLITSGSVINLSEYKKIGAFDENLFIDFVDTEYCFRSILKGYDVIELLNVFMHHEIGTTTQQRSLKNLKLSKRSIHSELRLYYMTRNYFYISSMYKKDFKQELETCKKDIINRIKNQLLYNNHRIKTIRFIIKAWKDFKQKKMGSLY